MELDLHSPNTSSWRGAHLKESIETNLPYSFMYPFTQRLAISLFGLYIIWLPLKFHALIHTIHHNFLIYHDACRWSLN